MKKSAINLRSSTGNPADVTLKGGGYGTGCTLFYFGASSATNFLTGLTISGFHTEPTQSGATYNKRTRVSGGAIFQESGTTWIDNCVFVSNSVLTTEASITKGGGAIWIDDGSLICLDSQFKTNFIRETGGYYYGGAVGFQSNSPAFAEFRRCRFVGNYLLGSYNASAYGGAVFKLSSGGKATAYDCEFIDNYAKNTANTTAANGGAIWHMECHDCTFINNYATGYSSAGGGTAASFYDCSFLGATNNAYGLIDSEIPVYRCFFKNCQEISNPKSGARGPIFKNCLFDRNKAIPTTGVGGHFNSSTLINCTVTGSYGTSKEKTYQNPLALNCSVYNCLFTGNTNSYPNGEANCDMGKNSKGTATAFYTFYDRPNESATYMPTMTACSNITDVAKLHFKGTGDNPYAIGSKSILRGAGDASLWTDSDTDILGRPRLRNGECDVGCYQYWDTSFHLIFR